MIIQPFIFMTNRHPHILIRGRGVENLFQNLPQPLLPLNLFFKFLLLFVIHLYWFGVVEFKSGHKIYPPPLYSASPNNTLVLIFKLELGYYWEYHWDSLIMVTVLFWNTIAIVWRNDNYLRCNISLRVFSTEILSFSLQFQGHWTWGNAWLEEWRLCSSS